MLSGLWSAANMIIFDWDLRSEGQRETERWWWDNYYSPPVTDKYLLVEHRPVGTDEGDGVEGVRTDGVPQTDVIHLTLLLRVSVVTTEGEAVTGEGCVLGSRVDGIVNPGLSWDGVSEPVQGVASFMFGCQDNSGTQTCNTETCWQLLGTWGIL